MGIKYIQIHVGDFLGGTLSMDATEVGAYWMLLLAHYQAGVEGLADNENDLARIAKVSLKVWRRISPKVMAKFTLTNSLWSHSKVVEELRRVNNVQSQNSAKSLKRWNAPDATALQQESELITDNHITNKERKKVEKKKVGASAPDVSNPTVIPDWLDQSDWESFVEMRKKARKPLTARAASLIIQQLSDMRAKGHDPTKALQNSIVGGWSGVYEPRDEKNGRFGGEKSEKRGASAWREAVGNLCGTAENAG